VIRITLQTFSHSSMFSHMNPDVLVTRSSYEPGYNRNPEVTSVVTERRINPFSQQLLPVVRRDHFNPRILIFRRLRCHVFLSLVQPCGYPDTLHRHSLMHRCVSFISCFSKHLLLPVAVVAAILACVLCEWLARTPFSMVVVVRSLFTTPGSKGSSQVQSLRDYYLLLVLISRLVVSYVYEYAYYICCYTY
jgi:hypothetical protein